ncbi:alpha/beta fold hydrolase [Ectobacillus panaciterrae]|uniref:alpha/beta fold hydrolase n=1 Tax=Ectobacillus panaciterrae TaxID=363872 RepID=UPI000412F731
MEGKSVILTPEQQAAANKALEGFDFRPDLNKVTAKTLVISGKYDGLNPPELGREIASLIPDSTFVEFEKSGHAPNVEEHKYFMELVINFLT